MNQKTLFGKTIDERFAEWIGRHPEVYEIVRENALLMRRRGFGRYSMKTLFEVVRWHFHLERGEGEEFKLNNDYTALMARLLMKEEPELKGFFEVRKRTA